MVRFLNILLLLGVVALTVLLYQLKYESRMIDAQTVETAQKIEDERDMIAILKAEYSLLIRPERIEKLAKRHLGMKEVEPGQVVTYDWLKDLNKPKNASLQVTEEQ